MTRGEIWWVDFGVPQGSEAGYRHPAIVVQNDNYKDNLFLTKNKTKLPKDSVACIPLITSVDKDQLDEMVCKLSVEDMMQLDEGLDNLLKV